MCGHPFPATRSDWNSEVKLGREAAELLEVKASELFPSMSIGNAVHTRVCIYVCVYMVVTVCVCTLRQSCASHFCYLLVP